MKYAINIGQYNSLGKIENPEWITAVDLLKVVVNYFVVYCSQNVYTVLKSLRELSNITELKDLGNTCGYKAYKLAPSKDQFWVEFQNINFHPDDGISHSYGYDEAGNCVSSLEINDETNYLVIECVDGVLPFEWTVMDKSNISDAEKENIEDLTEGEGWKLLLINS